MASITVPHGLGAARMTDGPLSNVDSALARRLKAAHEAGVLATRGERSR